MWYIVYNLFLFLVSPFAILLLLAKKRSRPGFWQRVGLTLPPRLPPHGSTLWVHAVSMGEVLAVVPLINAIHKQYPQLDILISTITETGREAVVHRLAGIARHCYLPLDWFWTVRRFIRHIQPLGFLVVETELWPNLFKHLHQQGVITVVVNGRLSSRSFQRYQWVASFMKHVLSPMTLCLMQSERDRDRIVALGANPDQVYRTGNMKFDHVSDTQTMNQVNMSPATIGLMDGEDLIVAGSTHPKEEETLFEVYKNVSNAYDKVVLLLAPRHIERADEVEKTVRSYGLHVIRRSQLPQSTHGVAPAAGPRVIILDTRGELAHLYGLARVAFVGGTLVPVGGHNLLEPAISGRPVFFGPYTDHCQEIADLLLEAGGGIQVQNGNALTNLFNKALQDPEWADRLGQAAHQVVLDNQGVVQRNLHLIREVLDSRVAS